MRAAPASAGLEEAQRRIGRLRGKWDTRHTYLYEQQQEASQVLCTCSAPLAPRAGVGLPAALSLTAVRSQIIKSLVSPRVLRTHRGTPMNQHALPPTSDNLQGRLCVLTSFSGDSPHVSHRMLAAPANAYSSQRIRVSMRRRGNRRGSKTSTDHGVPRCSISGQQC